MGTKHGFEGTRDETARTCARLSRCSESSSRRSILLSGPWPPNEAWIRRDGVRRRDGPMDGVVLVSCTPAMVRRTERKSAMVASEARVSNACLALFRR